jgi:MFS family permease
MGLLVTVRYIAGTAANFPSGMIADLVGRHHLILAIALAWVGIPYLFVGLSSSYTLLLLCMTLIGIGNNLWHPAALTLLTETYPQRKGWAMGWNASAANIGDALGPFLSGIFLAWVTWRQILVGSCVPGLGMSLLILWLLGGLRKSSGSEAGNLAREKQPKGKKKLSMGEYFRGLSNLLVNPSILFLSLVNGVRSLTQNGLSTFLPSFFMHSLMLSPWVSGVYMTIIQGAGIVAAPISGRLSDQYGRKRIVTAALISTSVAVFLLAFLNIPWLFVVFLAVVGFFLYSLRPVLIAWAMEVAPKELGGSVVGIQFTFQSALSAIAPVLGGWIADRWGLMYTFYFLGAVLLLSNVLVLFIKEPSKSEVATS